MKLLKKLTVPLIIFITVGILDMFLIRYSIILMLIILGLDFLFLIFSIICCSYDYQFKYLFLGRRFRKQLDDYCIKHQIKDIWKNKEFMKLARSNYRRTGNAFFDEQGLKPTPDVMLSDFLQQHDELIISNSYLDLLFLQELYHSVPSGAGLYHLFENINEKISYEEYKSTVAESSIINESLRKILMDESLEIPYRYVNHEGELTQSESELLTHFEKDISPLSEAESLVKENYEQYAISHYIHASLESGIHKDMVSLYYREETKERVTVYKDSSGYSFMDEYFVFIKDGMEDATDFESAGNFVKTARSITPGIYDTLEDLLKDYKEYLKDFVKVK